MHIKYTTFTGKPYRLIQKMSSSQPKHCIFVQKPPVLAKENVPSSTCIVSTGLFLLINQPIQGAAKRPDCFKLKTTQKLNVIKSFYCLLHRMLMLINGKNIRSIDFIRLS